MLEFSESKMKILNVGLLGLAFMLAFTAFNVSNVNDFYKIRPRILLYVPIYKIDQNTLILDNGKRSNDDTEFC